MGFVEIAPPPYGHRVERPTSRHLLDVARGLCGGRIFLHALVPNAWPPQFWVIKPII